MKRKSVAARLPKPPVFYDTGSKCFWLQGTDGTYIPLTETAAARHLQVGGLSGKATAKAGLSAVGRELTRIQLEHNVRYVGELAGYLKGPAQVCGNKILVTRSPKVIQPRPGHFNLLTAILHGMLNDPVQDQRPFLWGWLKCAREALRSGSFRPGQALVLAGPAATFKSGLQNLITLMLGGRSAKPYRYMAGQTQFNADLFTAEHLMIEDEFASPLLKHRRHFGSRIKDFTVNEVQSFHPKWLGAISLRVFWRLSVSLNDEPENLLILPPLDESLADKIILLKVSQFDMPVPTATIEQRRQFWDALVAELPGFLWWLERWQIPQGLISQRFGVTHFHHPKLLGAIDSLAPEIRLLEIIDAALFPPGAIRVTWQGTAEQLVGELVNSSMSFEARKLLDWNNAAGTYLGRLAGKRGDRVESSRTGEARRWTIKPPKREQMTP